MLVLQVALLIFLFLASAFFSGSEVALFSLDDAALESFDDPADAAGMRVRKLLDNPRQVLVSILILNTMANVGAAIIAAIMVSDLAVVLGWSRIWTVLAEMVALTFILLVVSEITPKLIASRNAPRYSRYVSGPLLTLHRILLPISRVLAGTMSRVQRRLAVGHDRHLSPEDLKAMAEIGEAHGTLEEEERELIYSIVEFGETTVREVMVSRLDIVALPTSASVDEALDVIRASGHSRLPLYVEHLDNILGIVYAKDLLPHLSHGNGSVQVDWARIARPPMFVPLGKKLDDLLRDFQARKTHLAIAVDEYGGTAGLVTLEDLLEEIVGEIRDEHDEQESELFERLSDDTYRFDARIDLDELNEIMGIHLETEEFDFETLGGLIFHVTGEIPTEGEEIRYDSLQIRVETIESNRIGKALVHLEQSTEDAEVEARRED